MNEENNLLIVILLLNFTIICCTPVILTSHMYFLVREVYLEIAVQHFGQNPLKLLVRECNF